MLSVLPILKGKLFMCKVCITIYVSVRYIESFITEFDYIGVMCCGVVDGNPDLDSDAEFKAFPTVQELGLTAYV